jgi:CheY-like chemotaxis protein
MPKILVIDDDQDFLDATRMVLERARYDVAVAVTPDEGLKLIKSLDPDLVILDVMMPSDYEGFAVARAIREDLNLRDLPIIILSAVHERKQVPYRFGADPDYLPVDTFLDKPLDVARLVDSVRRLLGEERVEPEHPL